MGFLRKFLEDAGRAVGTAADAVVPGNQSNWHQPAPASTANAQPRPTLSPARLPDFTKPNPLPRVAWTPLQAPNINMPLETAKQAVGGIASDVRNMFTHAPVHLALEGADILGNTTPDSRNVYQASNPVTKAVFGSQPIKSYQGQAEDASRQLKQMGVNPTLASAASIPAAGLLAGMDFAPFALKGAKVRESIPKPVEPLQAPKSFAPAIETAQVPKAPQAAPVQPTAPIIGQELPTNGVKQVPALDKIFRSTRSVIERQGEHGQQLAGMLQRSRDTEELFQADLIKNLPTVMKLKGKDFENFVEATQGRADPNSPKIGQAISEWQAVHPTIRDRAVNAGLDVGDLGPTYYPHFIDYQRVFGDKNTYNQAINHLVETGQAKSAEDAIKLLGHARDVSRNRTFGNLEASRTIDLPMYDKTTNSLRSYLQSATRRISHTETFGAKDENALGLITKAGQQGFDTEAMKNAYDVAVGARKYNPSTEAFSRGVRRYITTTRLGLGALTNTSQSVNTGIVTGHLRTLGSMVKQLDPKTRDFVADTGTISDAILNDIRSQSGFESFGKSLMGKVADKVTAPGFGAVEKFNRAVASTSGRDYALRLAQKGDEKTLRKLGVTGEIKNKTLTKDQQIQAARKVVEKTQFKVDPQDLPGWVDSPGGKLVAQFRTFSYAQGKFFSNEIVKPAAKGNLVPLGRLLAAIPVGYGLYEVRRRVDGRPAEENKGRVAVESFSKVGGAGLAVDLFRGMVPLNGKYVPTDRRVSMAVGNFGGPAFGQATNLIGGVSEAIQRKNVPTDNPTLEGKVGVGVSDGKYTDVTSLARQGIQQLPVAGTPIANRVLPYKKPDTASTDTGSVLTGDTTTPEYKQAQKDKKAERQAALDAGTRLGGTKELNAAQTRIDSAQAKLPTDMSGKSKDVLTRYAKLNAKGKDKFSADPKNTLSLHEAQYEQKKLNGDLNSVDDYKAKESLAKERVTSNYSNDALDLYGMSKARQKAYLQGRPDADKLYAEAQKLDKALVDAGFISSAKYKYGLGSKGKKAKKFNYASVSKTQNFTALRNLVRRSTIKRKKVSA